MENQQNSQPQATMTILDEGKLYQFHEQLRLEQNMPLALLGGTAAALIGALLWAIITVATNLQVGYMAVGVGFLVGYTVRFTGKGLETEFGVLGAVLALVGCLLGNLFSMIGFIANDEGLGYFQVFLGIDYGLVPRVMMESFSPIDILFYGLAIYEGYRFSFRHISEEEIIARAGR
ncbi:MAG TPA: hypothetical protein VIH22_10105 [Cyclobacteriaceae bacterium]|jgi:hypothetical protein